MGARLVVLAVVLTSCGSVRERHQGAGGTGEPVSGGSGAGGSNAGNAQGSLGGAGGRGGGAAGAAAGGGGGEQAEGTGGAATAGAAGESHVTAACKQGDLCNEYYLPPGTTDYAMECVEIGGTYFESCPDEGAVGVCENTRAPAAFVFARTVFYGATDLAEAELLCESTGQSWSTP